MKALAIAPPRDITIPEANSTTARTVLSQAMRRSIQDLIRLVASGRDPVLRSFKPTLQRLLREAPGPVASALRSPTVGGLLRCLRRGVPQLSFSAGVSELVATLLTDLATRHALPERVSLERPPRRIVSLPGRRVLEVPAGTRRVDFENGRVRFVVGLGPSGEAHTVALDDAPDETAPTIYEPIAGDIVLALVDNNPIAMAEAHPDKQGNAIDLGERPAREWADTLAEALAIIGRYLPELRAEIDLYIHQIVPVGYDPRKHLSASYQEIIGTIYMTLHPNLMTMVEATIHEFQHNKLHALLELDPLLHNAFSPLYASPVRPDPRPLQGVLLAVHAFQPVARLYQRMREAGESICDHPDFQRRYGQVIDGNHEGATVLLENAEPTPIGASVLDEIRRWDTHAWQ